MRHRPQLAVVLSNLAACHHQAGQLEHACHAASQAVAHFRKLVAAEDGIPPQFALFIHNLRTAPRGGPAPEQAQAAESAETYPVEHLRARALLFLPGFASALHYLGTYYGRLGRREEAFITTNEAVVIRQHLADLSPALYQEDLAHSLRQLMEQLPTPAAAQPSK